jgi:Uma2 family endonuclease
MRAHCLSASQAHRNDETDLTDSRNLGAMFHRGIASVHRLAGKRLAWHSTAMNAYAETYRFTVEEYNKLGEVGFFHEDDRVELLNGEIIIMAPIGKRHVLSVRNLNNRLMKLLGDVCLVDCQNPFILDGFSEPQPDILLLHLDLADVARPADIFVAVEVADSSVRYDSTTKLSAYARAGIPENWIVNLEADAVDVYRRPSGEKYAEHFRCERDGKLAPAAFPDRLIAVAEILP